MSSDRPKHPTRRLLLIAGVSLLGACGFTPVYGPAGSGGKLQKAVSFQAPDTEFGFRVRTALEDRFGPASSEQFRVEISLSSTTDAAAIDVDGDISRFDISGVAQWVIASVDGSAQTRGVVRTFTSYSATGSTVATQTAERDARTRLAQALADMIASDLIIAAGTLP